ncbi:MAG: glycosyltransferase family 2 protein [Chitinophagaceae bacterium]
MLSVIIVNYNVKYFLEQCLYSVQKAIAGIKAEVIVVDNNSTDESVGYLRTEFPWVRFISNTANSGFAKANNQGLQMATGEYILFLNPDTILSEDCLEKSIAVLQQQKRTGALGIHMVDGSGRFLPESKRGFPSLGASFFKLTGLLSVFPQSKTIAQYYLGHLPEKKNSEIDVLSGAYLMVKKEVLEKTGGFDERFFMYGEDIDLSYRIQQAGYINYYLADSSIIHFKGESTKKDIVYTKLFYKAMSMFAAKHYGKQSLLFGLPVRMAIAVRGALSFTAQLFKKDGLPATTGTVLRTIVVGSHYETAAAAAALMNNQTVKRNIVTVTTIREMTELLTLQNTGEVIFCAGETSYKSIIDCIQNQRSNIDYMFYADGSKSIVGSMSKKSKGETLAWD